MRAKKFFLRRDSNHCPPDPQPQLLTTALQSTYLTYSATEFILALLQSNRDHSKMKNESVKKSLEKSKNVLEKRKTVKRKICIKKTHTFTIIAMNCVQEQLIMKMCEEILKKDNAPIQFKLLNFF